MKYVKDLDDFYIHTKNHIRNVNILASELLSKIEIDKSLREYYSIPADYDFDNLRSIVMGAVSLHDSAKITIKKDFLEIFKQENPSITII